MADILPQMELCPHCKKQFKRLKSHLPFCKKVGTILPFNSEITNSKAAFFQAPKSKKLPKKLIKTDREETLKKDQIKRRNTNLMKVRLHNADLEMRLAMQTGENMKKQIKNNSQVTQNSTRPKKVVFLAENGHLFSAEKKISKAKFTKYLPKSGEDKSKNPSEIFGSSPSKSSFTNENKTHWSGLQNDNRMEYPEQKFLAETLDFPFSICESFPSLDRSQNPYATLQNNERGLKAWDPISEASYSVNNSEMPRKSIGSLFSTNYVNSSLSKSLQTGGRENHHIKHRAKKKGFHFGLAARKCSWDKESNYNKSPEVKVPKLDYMRDGLRKQVNNNNLAIEKIPHHDDPDSGCEEPLSLADLGNQSLSTLVLKYLQEEEDGYKDPVTPVNPVESKKPVFSEPHLNPNTWATEPPPNPNTWATHTKYNQQPLNLACHLAPKNLTGGHIETTGSKSLPTSMGLEWFPELYPGYQHLGVLPGRSQKGNIEVQKPHYSLPEEERVLQAPPLERSLMDFKIAKLPFWFRVSNFSIMGLLGKVQKELQRWRKHH
ncbi:mitochondrial nucleoid-associated protein 1 isoform X2 [Sminthopsis crassicaudata]|uniref:mitochondrial nucleoid-associated protein 1 isoform X2 n=1 Tax=Sminthopsis crassicaudata TaxID=9301 RepID=UPI003D68A29C